MKCYRSMPHTILLVWSSRSASLRHRQLQVSVAIVTRHGPGARGRTQWVRSCTWGWQHTLLSSQRGRTLSEAVVLYQVATPSRVRTRGSVRLVRLLKVFRPVSNPRGLTHVRPDSEGLLQLHLVGRIWFELRTRRRSFSVRIMVVRTVRTPPGWSHWSSSSGHCRAAGGRLHMLTSHFEQPDQWRHTPFNVTSSRRDCFFESFLCIFSYLLFMYVKTNYHQTSFVHAFYLFKWEDIETRSGDRNRHSKHLLCSNKNPVL